MAKQVEIDRDQCMGCEACVELCPDIFEFDSDEVKAVVIKPEGGDEKCIEDAVASCPAGCITYE